LAAHEVVAHRADAAEPLHRDRHLPVRPALDEALEAAELDDVQPGLLHLAALVEQDRDLAVTLDTGDRFDHDAACSIHWYHVIPDRRQSYFSSS
jgi:hypothetical protein